MRRLIAVDGHPIVRWYPAKYMRPFSPNFVAGGRTPLWKQEVTRILKHLSDAMKPKVHEVLEGCLRVSYYCRIYHINILETALWGNLF